MSDNMAAAIDTSFSVPASRSSSVVAPARSHLSLEDKYQVVKEIGDGSFGSVVLGRTRSAGAHAVRRNTMVRSCPVLQTMLTSPGRHQDDEKDL